MRDTFFCPVVVFFSFSARQALLALGFCCLAALAGCAGAPRSEQEPVRDARSRAPQRAALVDGTLVTRDALWPLLAERAGAAALEAIALDRAVQREAERAGVQVLPADIAAERAIVEMALVGAGLADRQQRGRVVAEARARRGWGPQWFEALLRRNALARKLTREDAPEPSQADVVRAFEALHGERRRVRVIVQARERDLVDHRAAIVDALARSRELGEAMFIMRAVEHSSDVSASRGGLLDAFTRVDATYPDAFREAVFKIGPSELTDVVALDEGFALAMVVAAEPGDTVTLQEVRPELIERLRLDAQQSVMAALFERLRANMRVEPLDDALDWSWRTQAR